MQGIPRPALFSVIRVFRSSQSRSKIRCKNRVGGSGLRAMLQPMNDYERVARIIRLLDERQREQPSLDDLAAAAGLSGSRLHRLFVEWVAITPKDFLQCLTLQHAKAASHRGSSVLDAALDSGLSGPGRLHDLCVTLEAATPGEVKSGGAGLEIVWGMGPTPFGNCLLAEAPRGICHLSFVDAHTRRAATGFEGPNASDDCEIRKAWPKAVLRRDDAAMSERLDWMFDAKPGASNRNLRAWVRGTEFQIRVWRALLEIPRGGLASYGQLAKSIGRPKASRAVGAAVGSNSLAWLIPCHRVIRETGAIGGYRWGAGRKRALIAWETSALATA